MIVNLEAFSTGRQAQEIAVVALMENMDSRIARLSPSVAVVHSRLKFLITMFCLLKVDSIDSAKGSSSSFSPSIRRQKSFASPLIAKLVPELAWVLPTS